MQTTPFRSPSRALDTMESGNPWPPPLFRCTRVSPAACAASHEAYVVVVGGSRLLVASCSFAWSMTVAALSGAGFCRGYAPAMEPGRRIADQFGSGPLWLLVSGAVGVCRLGYRRPW